MGGGATADFNGPAALHADDGVLIVTTIGHRPALIVAAAITPLNDLSPVGGLCAGGIHRLAAVPGDDAVRAIGDRAAAAATAGAGRRCASVTRQPTEIGLRALM